MRRGRIAPPQLLDRLAFDAVMGDEVLQPAVELEKRAMHAFAKLHRVARDRVEHRLHAARRCGHHPQDLGGGDLLGERHLRRVARTPELELGALPLRDVAQRADQLDDAPVLPPQSNAAVEHPLVGAAAIGDAVLVLEVLPAAREVLDERGTVAREILGVHPRVPCRGRQLLGGNAEEGLRAVGEKQLAGREVPLVNAFRCR